MIDSPYRTEPTYEQHHGIFCFDCQKPIKSKAAAADKHHGHDVDYLNAKGERA